MKPDSSMEAVAQQVVEAEKPDDKMEAVAQQAVNAEEAENPHPPLPPPNAPLKAEKTVDDIVATAEEELARDLGGQQAASKARPRRPASGLEFPAEPDWMRETKAKKNS